MVNNAANLRGSSSKGKHPAGPQRSGKVLVNSGLYVLKEARAASQAITKIPAAQAVTNTSGAPKFMTTADNTITVRHREFVSVVAGTAAFTAASLPVNPAQARLFPWLSRIAGQYQKYRVNRCVVQWCPIAGTDRDGTVAIAHSPDPLSDVPSDKQALYSIAGCREGALYVNNIKCDLGRSGWLFTRPKIDYSGDLKTYDYGQVIYATSDCESTAAMGQLFVDYEITFADPAVNELGPMAVKYYNAATWSIDVLTDNVYNGASDTLHTASTYPVVGPDLAYFNATGGTNRIYFRRPGQYLVNFIWGNSNTTIAGFTAGTGCTLKVSYVPNVTAGTIEDWATSTAVVAITSSDGYLTYNTLGGDLAILGLIIITPLPKTTYDFLPTPSG